MYKHIFFCFLTLIQITTLNVCNLYSNFQKLLKTEFSSSTIAPGKSGSKNLKLREKYKSTKFPNAFNFIARSQILMFPF